MPFYVLPNIHIGSFQKKKKKFFIDDDKLNEKRKQEN